MPNPLAVAIVLTSSAVGAMGTVFLKKASGKISLSPLSWIRADLISGILLEVISAGAYIFALRLERLSILYPLASATYVWVSLLSVKFLKERMNTLKWAGIALIVTGVALINA